MPALRLVSLAAWAVLFAAQASLLLPAHGISPWWPALLLALLLPPLPGLLRNRRYTYRWVGFLALLYFCIGVSEMVANEALRGYALATLLASLALFLASIYHARGLGPGARMGGGDRPE